MADYLSNLVNENYISIEDAALFLNIKPVTLRKWIKDKSVPALQKPKSSSTKIIARWCQVIKSR